LGLLYRDLHTQGLEEGRHFGGLVPDDCHHRSRLEGLTSTNHMFDQSASAGTMENFGEGGLQTSSFTCGENNNGKVMQSHGQLVFSVVWIRVGKKRDRKRQGTITRLISA
jgi:hypothetical protein